ncbi:hypothetical protein [Atlantibacter sp.]|uniref:hypothetical protein n=1 Tax=Atlantibacter sp. TaxID=1903473 RepID=UPI0028AF0F55|nr:hypothetical protein [Atlantibacter sp.]
MDQLHSPPVFRQPGGLHRRTRLVSLVTWLNITVQRVFPVAIAFMPAITRAAERGP